MEALFIFIWIIFGVFAVISIGIFLGSITTDDDFSECHWWLWAFLLSAVIIVGTAIYANTTIKTEYRIPVKEVKKVSYTSTDDWGKLITKSYYSWKDINNLLVDDKILKYYDTLFVVKTEVMYEQAKYSVILSSSIVRDTIKSTGNTNQKLK